MMVRSSSCVFPACYRHLRFFLTSTMYTRRPCRRLWTSDDRKTGRIREGESALQIRVVVELRWLEHTGNTNGCLALVSGLLSRLLFLLLDIELGVVS